MKLAGALADSTASPDAVIGVPGWATLRLFRWDELALEMTTFGSFRAAQVALRARAPDPVATIVTSSPFWALEPAKAMPLSWMEAAAAGNVSSKSSVAEAPLVAPLRTTVQPPAALVGFLTSRPLDPVWQVALWPCCWRQAFTGELALSTLRSIVPPPST